MKTRSPLLPALPYNEKVLKAMEPLKITDAELERLTIKIMDHAFISFGSALICPKCGVQQGVLTNHAPDGEVNFYLRFNCPDYRMTEDEEKKAIEDHETETVSSKPPLTSELPDEPQHHPE